MVQQSSFSIYTCLHVLYDLHVRLGRMQCTFDACAVCFPCRSYRWYASSNELLSHNIPCILHVCRLARARRVRRSRLLWRSHSCPRAICELCCLVRIERALSSNPAPHLAKSSVFRCPHSFTKSLACACNHSFTGPFGMCMQPTRLRAAVSAKTPVGLKAKAAMDAGALVTDEIVFGIIEVITCLFIHLCIISHPSC